MRSTVRSSIEEGKAMRFLNVRREHPPEPDGDAQDGPPAVQMPAPTRGVIAGSQASPSALGPDLPRFADGLASGLSRRKFLVGTGVAVGAGASLSGIACRRQGAEAATLASVSPTAGTSWAE